MLTTGPYTTMFWRTEIPGEEEAMSPFRRTKGWVQARTKTKGILQHLCGLADLCFLLWDGHVNDQY